MKPDDKNTGSVESVPATGELAIRKNPDQRTISVAEAQPVERTLAPEPPLPLSPAAAKTTEPTPESTATADNTTTDSYYEAGLAQLPAEDSGPIESEWIQKADEIVAKTSSDPYHQDDAQHSLSRAYLKKRFNLEIE